LPSLTDLLLAHPRDTPHDTLDSGGIQHQVINNDDLLHSCGLMMSYEQRMNHANSSYLSLNSTLSPEETSASQPCWSAAASATTLSLRQSTPVISTPEMDFSQEYSHHQINAVDSHDFPPGSHHTTLNNDHVQGLKNWADQVSTAQNLTPAQIADMHTVVNVSCVFKGECT